MLAEPGPRCEILAWDTEFWGFPIARIVSSTLSAGDVERIDDWCRDRRIACAWLSLPFDDPVSVRQAEDGGFRLVDGRVTWVVETARPVPGGVSLRPGLVFRESIESDIAPLGQMAAASFQTTRFYFDLNFPRDRCAMLYERWIVESCRGFADHVAVAEMNGEPVGYVTCHLSSSGSEGRMGLLGVAPAARKHGIGRSLLARAASWFHERNTARMLVPTQARNLPIQALCAACGALPQGFELYYHKWFSVPGTAAS